MTINLSDNTPRVSYTVAQGATQTSFTVSFEFFADADLNVYVDNVLKTLTTDYTVSGGSGSTGTVTISVTGATGGSTVVITRDIALERTTDFPASGAFQIGSLNTELDKITAQFADRKDAVDRSLRLQDSDAAGSMELPLKATRAGTVLGFNATTGVPEAGPKIADVSTLSAVTADIATLADIEDGTDATDAISGLAAIKANVTTVAGIASNVTSVAGNASNINSAVSNASNINSAVSNASNINAAVSNASNINAAVSNASNINAASGHATTATTKASEASTSATASASSATASASSASTSSTKATESSTHSTVSSNFANKITGAVDDADGNTTGLHSSKAWAIGGTGVTDTAGKGSAKSWAIEADAVDGTEHSAKSYATSGTVISTGSAKQWALGGGSGFDSNTAVSGSLYSAKYWSEASSTSATASANSATASANSAAAAASALDSFDDRYLGSKTSDPTVDNDGNALVSGALYFNSSANEMRVYDGANWIAASSAGTASLILYEYTATSGQTTFSGSDDNSATLSYSAGNIQVVMNGVILDPSDFTATSGTSVVLASGAVTGDLLNIYAFKSFTVSDTVSASAGGTFAGNVTVNALLNVDNLRLDGNTISSTDTNGDITIDPDGTGNTIIASGNVGIGTTSPPDHLSVVTSGSNAQLSVDRSDGASGRTVLIHSSTGGHLQTTGSVPLIFGTADTERMRIDESSGNLLVGITSQSNVGSANGLIVAADGGSQSYIQISNTSTSDKGVAYFNNGNGLVGTIRTENSGTSYNTSSDYRLKTAVTYDWDATTRLKQLKPARFNFIADADTTVDGFLAHEAQAVVPESVTGTKDEVEVWKDGEELPDGVSVGDNKLDADGNTIPVMQGIDQSKLVPLLVKTIQELEARITALEAE